MRSQMETPELLQAGLKERREAQEGRASKERTAEREGWPAALQKGLEGQKRLLDQQAQLLAVSKERHKEQELAARDQRLQQQDQTLQELQKQQYVSMEELGKEKCRVEELVKAKSALEGTSSRLTSKLKVLTVKSQKALVGLQEAKQLLIQQKLEVQGQLEAVQAGLQQEQQEHQATRDAIAQ